VSSRSSSEACQKRYAQIVNLIEMLLDFEQLTIEDVTGRFKSV
jgi:hypothetical protein